MNRLFAFTDAVSEENLHLIEVEACHLRQSYEQKKSLYDKVKQREQLWSRFVELEVRIIFLHVKLDLL